MAQEPCHDKPQGLSRENVEQWLEGARDPNGHPGWHPDNGEMVALCELAMRAFARSSVAENEFPWRKLTVEALEFYKKHPNNIEQYVLLDMIAELHWHRTAPKKTSVSATAESWVPVDERLPADETPVLILRNGERRIAELRWERPTFEETFKAFRYWDDPNDDGQCWEWPEITHWRPLPELPGEYVPGGK